MISKGFFLQGSLQLKSGAIATRRHATGGCVASRKGLTDPATWQDLAGCRMGFAPNMAWELKSAKMEL